MSLHPDVIAELEAEDAAHRRKDVELSVGNRVNGLERRIVCLEAAARANPTPNLDEDFGPSW
jgi:hypothetical protein